MGASNLQLATATSHKTLETMYKYTHLDAQVTKKYSNHIAESILNREEFKKNLHNVQDRSIS